MKQIFTFLLIALSLIGLTASASNNPETGVGFTENKGQWPSEVRFLFQSQGVNAWITDFGVVYDFNKRTRLSNPKPHETIKGTDLGPEFRTQGHVVTFTLEQSNQPLEVELKRPHSTVKNYFLSNNTDKWATNVATYDEVMLAEVYQGVAIRYYEENGSLRYDFVVAPGADPNQIKWQIQGVSTEIDSNGELVLATSLGNVRQAELKTYQTINGKEQTIESSFNLQSNGLTFNVAEYDAALPLIIDPIIYIAEIGSIADDDEYFRIEVDANGNKWVYGETFSASYPTSSGAYSNTFAGVIDLVITKIDASGVNEVFSTYIGGNGEEELFVGNTTALSSDGGLVFTGTTQSTDFPTVVGAFDNTYNGDREAFVAKINATGTSLQFSTYYGGTDTDYGGGVVLDQSQNVYLMGWTNGGATSYPVTGGAYDQTANGGGDVGITKFNSTCSSVSYSTLFGGNAYDDCYGIALDNSNNVTIVGYTLSTDLPTSGGYQTTLGGNSDVYAFKLNSTGSGLIACTYLGGALDDYGFGFVPNSNGEVVLTGYSNSTDFPIQDGYGINQGGFDAVVAVLNSNLSSLIFSRYYGGSSDDYSIGVDTDAHNSIYIAGNTYSSNLFLINPDQAFNAGDSDGFSMRLRPNNDWIMYSSYFGGSGFDNLRSASANDAGQVYFAGSTNSSTLPTATVVYSDGFISSYEGLIVGLDVCHTGFSTASSNSPTCENSDIQLMSDGGQSYAWTGPNSYTSTQQNPVFTAGSNSGGTYNVDVSDLGCISSSSVNVTVDPALGTTIIGPALVDPLTPTNYVVSQNIGSTYTWSVTNGGTIVSGQGTNDITISFPNEGTATITVIEVNGNCTATTNYSVTIGCANPPTAPIITGASVATENTSENYSVPSQAGYTYNWTVNGGTIVSGAGTNSITVQWGAAGTGSVSIIWADANGCESSPTMSNITIQGGVTPAQWITIASDATGDGADPALMDATLLEYKYDSSNDSLLFRITVASMNATNSQEVGVNVHLLYSGGGATFDFWGDDNNATTNANGWHRMITTWVTGTPPANYSGTIGIADAAGVGANDFTNVAQNNINIKVNQTAKTITIGLLRASAIPASAITSPVTVAAAVGSNQFWNDDIYLPGATIDVGPQSIANPTEQTISLYPNPNNGSFTVDLTDSDFSQNAMLTVTDMTGRVIHSAQANNSKIFMDLNEIANGIYMLQINEQGLFSNSRIVVQK